MRAAVIGLGRMGLRHLQVIRQLRLDLVGVADIKCDALATAAREGDVPVDRQFNDPARLLDQTRPEVVIVATTAPTHSSYTCLAAEMGAKYVLCEKPMGVSLGECDAMLHRCRQRGVRLSINHQMRFMPQYTEPKELLQSEAFGGLSSVTVIGGNFGLAMNGTHYFEMFRYMADEPPVDVTAWLSAERVPNPRGVMFEDAAGSVRMTTAGGKRFYMDVSADQGHSVRVVYAGRQGIVVVDELAGAIELTTRQRSDRDLPTTRYGMASVSSIRKIPPADIVAPTRAVLEALLNGGNFPTGEDGRLAVTALIAAHISHENGHLPIRLDSDRLPRERLFAWA